MIVFILYFLLLTIVNSQPDIATLRPTVSPTQQMTSMPTMELSNGSSGEPERIITVSVALVNMFCLTVTGIYIIAYRKDDKCKQYKKIKPSSNV